jgi:5-methylcytosine-specific restriction endonuclease McrA
MPDLAVLNAAYLAERLAREPGHRRFMARLRKSPHRRVLWSEGMPDDIPRECQYCGSKFLPDLQRPVGLVPAPPSVLVAHRRAHCSPLCDYNLSGLRYVRIDRAAIFERDGWHCYLCGQHTPPELRAFGYVPNGPSIDHIVPQGPGTNDPDNLRCCCKLCNLEKGNATLWEKLSIYLDFEFDRLNIFSAVLLQLLPRQPTLEELIPVWRELLICDGRRIEDYIYGSGTRLIERLRQPPDQRVASK